MALALRTCYSKWLPCILIFAYFSVCCHCWQRCLLLVCCFARTAAATAAGGGAVGEEHQAACSRCIYIWRTYTCTNTHKQGICHGECSAHLKKTLVYSCTYLKYHYYWCTRCTTNFRDFQKSSQLGCPPLYKF